VKEAKNDVIISTLRSYLGGWDFGIFTMGNRSGTGKRLKKRNHGGVKRSGGCVLRVKKTKICYLH